MLERLVHGYYLFRASVLLALSFLQAGWYFRFRAAGDLGLPPAQPLKAAEIRRWKHYFFGTTYLAVVFAALNGHRRNRQERRLFSNLAALACFFDDLADTFRPNDDSGISWKGNPEQYGRTADPSGRALHFLQNIYEHLPPEHLAEFKQFMHRVFEVETAGRQQRSPAPDLPELARLTAEKGGYSVLLFRRVLALPLPAAEREALYAFGLLIQLCDDIFDLWFDRQTRTVTLATVLTEQHDLKGLRHLFEQQVAATARAIRQTPYPAARVETALRVVHFLVSITRVCLRHYGRLEKRLGGLPLDNRAAMVVDMARWANRWRAGWALMDWGMPKKAS